MDYSMDRCFLLLVFEGGWVPDASEGTGKDFNSLSIQTLTCAHTPKFKYSFTVFMTTPLKPLRIPVNPGQGHSETHPMDAAFGSDGAFLPFFLATQPGSHGSENSPQSPSLRSPWSCYANGFGVRTWSSECWAATFQTLTHLRGGFIVPRNADTPHE